MCNWWLVWRKQTRVSDYNWVLFVHFPGQCYSIFPQLCLLEYAISHIPLRVWFLFTWTNHVFCVRIVTFEYIEFKTIAAVFFRKLLMYLSDPCIWPVIFLVLSSAGLIWLPSLILIDEVELWPWLWPLSLGLLKMPFVVVRVHLSPQICHATLRLNVPNGDQNCIRVGCRFELSFVCPVYTWHKMRQGNL